MQNLGSHPDPVEIPLPILGIDFWLFIFGIARVYTTFSPDMQPACRLGRAGELLGWLNRLNFVKISSVGSEMSTFFPNSVDP